MGAQVIARDGQPEYAVLPWAEYQELLVAAGRQPIEQALQGRLQEPEVFELSRLVALREARGISVEQLARMVGISSHYLGMIESGEREPDQAIQRALARVFAAPAGGAQG